MPTRLRYPKGYQFFSNVVAEAGPVPLGSGKLFYYEAGSTTPVDTYLDAEGLTPNENPIALNGSGRLETAVYIGTESDVKEILRDSDNATIDPWPEDDIPAAETEAESTTSAAALFAPSAKSAGETLTSSGFVAKCITADATGAAFTLTLPSAASVGSGVGGIVAKIDASANAVTVNTQGGQTINGASSYTLSAQFQAAYFLSDGANYRVVLEMLPAGSITAARLASTFITALTELKSLDRAADFSLWWDASASGFRKVASKFIDKREPDSLHSLIAADKDLTTPPGSPAEGDRYIVPSGASGSWSGQTGKVASYFDGAWVFYTPAAGWYCFVTDEAILYRYSGAAWVADAVTNSEIGISTPNGGTLKLKSIEQTTTLSGSSTNTATQIPIGIVLAVSCRVTTSITGLGGATSFQVGDGSTVDKFGSSLPFTAGTTNRGHIGPTGYYSGTNLVFTPNTGTFSGGVVRSVIWYLEITPPTA
jgi:hypothetical protein